METITDIDDSKSSNRLVDSLESKKSEKSTKIKVDTLVLPILEKKLDKKLGKKLGGKNVKSASASLTKKLGKGYSKKKKTIKQFCENYKYNTFGKENKNLYESCKVNQYCRKYKCHNVDQRFNKQLFNKLGDNANNLLMGSIYRKCPVLMEDKKRRRCISNATNTFYKGIGLGDIYSQVVECDKKTCAKERQIFHTNIFRLNKNKNKTKFNAPKLINIEDIPDQQFIEKN